MFTRKIRLIASFFSCLMFIQSFTVQALPSSVSLETVNAGIELNGCLYSTEKTEMQIQEQEDDKKEIFMLPSNTMVTLKTTQEISSKDIKKGEEITLRVAYDVMVKGKTVIPAGTLAKGKITHVRKPRLWGKPGEIFLVVEELQLNDKTIALVSDTLKEEGESRSTTAWVWFGVSMVILWPCIFIPFFLKGRHAIISANTSINAFTIQSLSLPVIDN